MNLSRGLCWLDNTASEQHLNTIIEATVVISILSVWTQRCSAICFANACDFGHTSLLNSRNDWHPIAQVPFFQAAKSVGWTYRRCLKLESHRCTRPQLTGKKFGFRLVYRDHSCSIGLFLSQCLREVGQRWAMWDLAPCQRFVLPSDWFSENNSPVKQKEWDDRAADRLWQP